MKNIPVLTYHKVSLRWELAYTYLHPRTFKKQMTHLRDKGYIGCSLLDYIKDPAENKFVITFDDAYENVAVFAMPILQDLGFTATVFVLKDFVGKRNTWDVSPGDIRIFHMNETQIRDLHAAGWEIASHGCSHTMMTLMGEADVQNELSVSKKYLEDLTQSPVTTFCYPFGVYDDRICELTREAGYTHLVGLEADDDKGVVGRATVYRVVDSRHSVLRKIKASHPLHFLEKGKERLIHSFSAITRLKQKYF